MKIALILAILFPLTIFAGAREEKIDLLQSLIKHYEERGLTLYGHPISLTLNPHNQVQAYASRNEIVPRIVVYEGVISNFEAGEIIFIVCHELGHLLTEDPAMRTFEGEADYFAGSCVQEFMGVGTDETIISAFEKLYQSKINYEVASGIVAPQSIEKYPSRECRALSALHGAQNLPRPACWFHE